MTALRLLWRSSDTEHAVHTGARRSQNGNADSGAARTTAIEAITIELLADGADEPTLVHAALELPRRPMDVGGHEFNRAVVARSMSSTGGAVDHDVALRRQGRAESPVQRYRTTTSERRWRRLWGEDLATRQRRRAWARIVGATLVVAAGGAIAVSPLFAAQEVTVTGLVNLSPEQVLAAGGVGIGSPLVTIRPAAVEERLESTPWIQSASVHRGFPRALSIKIVERAPVAVIPRAARWVTVDSEGRALQVTKARPLGLPELNAASSADVTNTWIAGRTLAAVRMVSHLPTPWRDMFREWTAHSDGTVSARLKGGEVVEFGNTARAEAKVIAAVTVVAHASADRGGVLDVRVPEVPLWRAQTAESSAAVTTTD